MFERCSRRRDALRHLEQKPLLHPRRHGAVAQMRRVVPRPTQRIEHRRHEIPIVGAHELDRLGGDRAVGVDGERERHAVLYAGQTRGEGILRVYASRRHRGVAEWPVVPWHLRLEHVANGRNRVRLLLRDDLQDDGNRIGIPSRRPELLARHRSKGGIHAVGESRRQRNIEHHYVRQLAVVVRRGVRYRPHAQHSANTS